MPKIGMRMMKTAIAVAICLLIYLLRGKQGVPVFSAIAAIICMQPHVDNSVTVAFNRIIGTLTGAVMGLLVIYIIRWIPMEYEVLDYVLIALAVIPAMYITVLLKRTGASAMAGVVLLSVTLSDSNYTPLMDAFNRSFETIVGILVSLCVNVVHLPRQRREEFFFVSGFDGALYDEEKGVSPYCVFELNQLLHDGLKFTIATERTPASLLADISQIQLNLPVIAMDGAVLYDIKEMRYLACNGLSKQNKEVMHDIIEIMKEKLEDDKDQQSYYIFKYLYHFLQAMDTNKELKYMLGYVSKAAGFVKPEEFVFEEEDQFVFESILYTAMVLYENKESTSKTKIAEAHKRFVNQIEHKREEKMSRTLELNTYKVQALKELGYTEINEKNASEVLEKIAEIQSRKVTNE